MGRRPGGTGSTCSLTLATRPSIVSSKLLKCMQAGQWSTTRQPMAGKKAAPNFTPHFSF